MKQYDQRLTEDARRALIEFKKAVYNLYVNYDSEVMAVGKPVESLWQLHNDIQDWGMTDSEKIDDALFDQLDHQPLPYEENNNLNCSSLPMIEALAKLLSMLDSDKEITIDTMSTEYDYTAKDLMTVTVPVLKSEGVQFDIYYNDDDLYSAILRIY